MKTDPIATATAKLLARFKEEAAPLVHIFQVGTIKFYKDGALYFVEDGHKRVRVRKEVGENVLYLKNVKEQSPVELLEYIYQNMNPAHTL